MNKFSNLSAESIEDALATMSTDEMREQAALDNANHEYEYELREYIDRGRRLFPLPTNTLPH